MKKLLTMSLLAVGLLFGLNGNVFAGYSPNMIICHCPPGHGGTHCFEITVNTQGAYNGHFKNHAYDHAGVCTVVELSTAASNSSDVVEDIGSGTVDGFTVPKPSNSNWKEK